jgi:hypothetical protein
MSRWEVMVKKREEIKMTRWKYGLRLFFAGLAGFGIGHVAGYRNREVDGRKETVESLHNMGGLYNNRGYTWKASSSEVLKRVQNLADDLHEAADILNIPLGQERIDKINGLMNRVISRE